MPWCRRRSTVAAATALAAVAGGALFGGCKVDIAVTVDASARGSGDVEVAATFDREAAAAVGDVEERLRVDDLRDAGWRVEEPVVGSDGSVEVVVVRRFDDVVAAAAALDEVGFGDLELSQRRRFFVTDTRLHGSVDLRAGIDAFGDADLAAAFGGDRPLGVSVEELERRLGEPAERAFALALAADLPGGSNGDAARWRLVLGEQLRVDASARQWNVRNIALLVAAVVSGLAALIVWMSVVRGGPRRSPSPRSH